MFLSYYHFGTALNLRFSDSSDDTRVKGIWELSNLNSSWYKEKKKCSYFLNQLPRSFIIEHIEHG